VFAFGPVYFGIINGQNATLSLLLYVLIYRSLVRGEDRAAGVWAAVGLFKPQLFFVFPLIFLAARRWRALGAYCATVAVLGLFSLAIVGLDGALGWLRILVDMETGNATRNAWRMHSLKSLFDLLLPGQTLWSLGLYALASVGLLALLFRAWSVRNASIGVLFAFTSLVAVLVDPHLVDYDLSVLVLAGAAIASTSAAMRWLIVLLYPMLVFRAQLPIGDVSLQLSTLVLMGCAYLILRRLRRPASQTWRDETRARTPGPDLAVRVS
jgi:hypothetical protein